MTRAHLITLAAAIVAIAAACSNSEEAAPSRTVIPAGTSSSGGAVLADAGDNDANVDPSCQGAEGCFKCEATRSIDILNSCTDGTCTPFDNTRLPLFVTGQPLPAVP